MTFDHKETRALADDLRLVAKCLKGENKFPTGQSVILESAATLTAALAEIERLREALTKIANAPSEMTWGEDVEVHYQLGRVEGIADTALKGKPT